MPNQPTNVKIKLVDLKPEELEYFCNSYEIDKEVFPALGHEFNEDLAKEIASHLPFYFIVKTNGEYDIVGGGFALFLKEKTIYSADLGMPFCITEHAQACKDHFIKHLIDQHKTHADILKADIKGSPLFDRLKRQRKNEQ